MKTSSIFYLSVLLSLTSSLFAQIHIPEGYVSGTWDSKGSPYLVEGNITVPDDSTLIIEPGVTIEFQGHFSLVVLGRLLAVGTETDSILFTVNDTTGFSDPDTSLGGWYGIRFLDTPVDNDSSKIVYCRLEFGKATGPAWHLNAGGAICILQFGKVHISNCLISNNKAGSTTDEIPIGGGLYLFRSDVTVRDNTFINNSAKFGGAIFFDDSDPVLINNIIKNNQAENGGAICFNGSDPTFFNNTIENNRAVTGGGISMGGENHPAFKNDKILNNIAENHGGGMLYQNSVVQCTGLTVSGNRAVWGGGIGVQGGTLTGSDCLLEDNDAEIWGGGIACDFGTLNLEHCLFKNDSSAWGSGGLHLDHAVAEITNCEFTGNRAVFGGGIHAVYSQVTSCQNEFIDNNADGGGGVHIEDSDFTLDRCLFQGNQALTGASGAIDYSVDSTIFGRSYRFILRRSNILENYAFDNSGGIRIEQLKPDFSMVDVTLDSCRITGNQSGAYGSLRIGGLIEDFVVSNSIFSGNTASRNTSGPGFMAGIKGRVYNCVFSSNYSLFSDSTKTMQGASLGAAAEVDFFNCTFTDTSSADGIGLSLRRGAIAHVTNCIFRGCGDRPINLTTVSGLGCTAYVNYCNIENGIDSIQISDSLSVLNWGKGNISDDPMFVDLKAGNLHLQDDSPCIGTGINSFILNDTWYNAPTRDIEGNSRPSPEGSNADMGAFENPLGSPVGHPGILIQTGEIIYNYPNPFREFTTIIYRLDASSKVDLTIYNMMGQKIATLVSEFQQPGQYRVRLNGEELQGGVLFYRLETDNGKAETGTMIRL